jgi:AcrR family transcriptional regulator
MRHVGQATRVRVPRAVREREMLDVAERAFARNGYDSVSMQAIAVAAGISKPMVYAYFGSKEGIYLACIRRARSDLYEGVRRAIEEAVSPDDQLWRGTLAFFDWVEQNEESYRVLYGPGSVHGEALAAELAELRGDQARLIARVLSESMTTEGEAAELEPTAFAIVGAAESLAAWWIESDEPKDRVVRRFMNLFWVGLGQMRSGATWQSG